jgi:DNA repair exonuclease SbcCD ATPase subunit
MRALRIASVALLLLTGTLSTACAQAEKPPPFGEAPPPEPPDPPAPPFGQEPRDKVRQLESEIHELEAALENKDATPEQRKKWTGQLKQARAELREIRERRHPQEARERLARLEAQARELKEALGGKEGSPEERKEWKVQLERVMREFDEARAALKPQEPPQEHHERLMARLREIEGLMKKVGPEDQKELAREAEKIREALKRGEMKMGPPMDPELHRLHGEIKELEHQSQQLGMKLRSLPAGSKEDRAEVQGKLKEAVTKLFDLREQARVREVEDLKKRLEELTRMLEKRKANRDQIIEKRIRQLSGELDELDW